MLKKVQQAVSFAVLSLTLLFSPVYVLADGGTVIGPEISAESAIMIDAETGIVIYEKNSNEILYPASTTKIMTALLFLEHIKASGKLEPPSEPDNPLSSASFDTRILFSHYAVYSIEPGSSSIYMNVDETLSLREALYAIMLPSANEVSVAIAEYVSGSEEEFTKKMTARAKELGCTNTNFTNSHGLPNNNHYTTAHDLALILREAVSHEELVEAISTRSYAIPPTEKQTEIRYLNNTNKLIQPGEFFYEYAIGGKTGYTDDARHTLVAYGEKDGIGIITAVLKCEKNFTYKDTITLMEYGFTDYAQIEAFDVANYSASLEIPSSNGGSSVSIEAVPNTGLSLFLPKRVDLSEIVKTPIVDRSISLPIKKGDVLGILQLSFQNAYLGSVELISSADMDIPAPAKKPATEKPTEAADKTASQDVESDVVPASTKDDSATVKNKSNTLIYIIVAAVIVAAVAAVAIVGIVFPKRNLRRSRYRISKRLYK